ncbi:MAG: hypothetical protein HC905_17415 [Bacteroidales bacterium]|nr:hypothetical protein [Bacteroidales bacterium]
MSYFEKNVSLPVSSVIDMEVNDTLSKALLNKVLFDQQKERAKFYTLDNRLFRATTYGKVPESLMTWNTWADEKSSKRITKVFETKAYTIGNIAFNKDYYALLVKIVGFEKTFIDLYLFGINGELKSFVSLYEVVYKFIGDPSETDQVHIYSSINSNGIITWNEERYNVKTKREYQLQPDGYFKIISQTSEGEFEL